MHILVGVMWNYAIKILYFIFLILNFYEFFNDLSFSCDINYAGAIPAYRLC